MGNTSAPSAERVGYVVDTLARVVARDLEHYTQMSTADVDLVVQEVNNFYVKCPKQIADWTATNDRHLEWLRDLHFEHQSMLEPSNHPTAEKYVAFVKGQMNKLVDLV